MASEWKVRLSCSGEEVVFEASAGVSESRTSTWDGYQITHLPTALLSYRYTSARKFGIQAKLVSRNREEASMNAKYLDLIRAWILPDFGGSGATPPTCNFNAYGNNNIQDLPVIIDQYSWSFPEDVDYIFTGTVPMPVIGTLTLELQEIWSAREITDQKWRINVAGSVNIDGMYTNTVNNFMQTLGFVDSTPSISMLGTGFSGVLSGNTAGDTGASTIMSNPTSGSLSRTSNSTAIIPNTPIGPNNPFISGGGIGGGLNLSGVPTAPIQSPAVQPRDGFNRTGFSIDIPLLG